MRDRPYPVATKPFGRALVDLAAARDDVVCLSGDLTRQTEVDLFRDTFPGRFFNVGMAEQNMVGIAGGLARDGFVVFVPTFGVFCTRRCFDQVAMAVGYPRLPVRLVGFMPGLSSPGGPSHQAVDDVALMRAVPHMTVLDVADATEIRQAVSALADLPGPAYLRLKRGEIPVIFDDDHRLQLDRAQVLREGHDLTVVTAGMMLPTSLAAAEVLAKGGVSTSVVHAPVVKPLDAATVLASCARTRATVVAENHSVVGGLGSAVAEALAESGLGRPLRRVGVRDTYAEGGSAAHLFVRYGLDVSTVVARAWELLELPGEPPRAEAVAEPSGGYAPV